jgi:hypothetical protein
MQYTPGKTHDKIDPEHQLRGVGRRIFVDKIVEAAFEIYKCGGVVNNDYAPENAILGRAMTSIETRTLSNRATHRRWGLPMRCRRQRAASRQSTFLPPACSSSILKPSSSSI